MMKHVTKLDHADLADLAINLVKARKLVDYWDRLNRLHGATLTMEQARGLYLEVYKLRGVLNATLGVLSSYRDALAAMDLDELCCPSEPAL